MILSKRNNYNIIYFSALIVITIGLPLSKFLMSFGQLILLFNWLLSGNIINNIRSFFKNKTALIISSLFLLHILGLIYTSDFNYAFKDLRVKIPLLVLPLVISTSEALERKRFHILMLVFISAVLASTFASIYNYFYMDYQDIREICSFISHIRLSLMICVSVFSLIYFITYVKEIKHIQKILFLLIIIWFVFFLIILESVTGIIIIIMTAIGLALREVFITKGRNIKKVLLISSILFFSISVYLYIHKFYIDFFSVPTENRVTIATHTKQGNIYFHDTLSSDIENCHFVWRYICESEMREAWNKRSSITYDGKDKKTQELKYTLIRFLTSKGYTKDAEGVNRLTFDEIKSVENGIANTIYEKKFSLTARIYEIIWEYENYKRTANPNGHSVMQRFEYWKASINLIKEHFLFGVGTGDMNIAFSEQYKKMNSPLDIKWRLRSHNQFLSITVGFGLVGLLWFLFIILYPFLYKKVRIDYFYFVFILILFLSMLTEDTIESQPGVTFFTFFNVLFLFGRRQEEENLS